MSKLLPLCERAIEIGTVLEYKTGVHIMEVQCKTGNYWVRTMEAEDGTVLIASDLNAEMIESAKPGGVMLDIGANIGRYSICMANVARKVFAFEPEPKNFAELQEMVNFTSDRRSKIIPVQRAIWNNHDPLTLYVRARRGEHSVNLDANVTAEAITVAASPLDSFCFEENMFDPEELTGIKIDVEGAEVQVVEGAIEVLCDTEAPIAIETHTGVDCKKLYDLLTKCGYKVMAPHGLFIDVMHQNCQYLCKKA